MQIKPSALTLTALCALAASAPLVLKSYPANKAGDISGRVELWGSATAAGLVVHVPGRSFQARLGASGDFTLNYVPAGSHTLLVQSGEVTLASLSGVLVEARAVTDVGTLVVAPDIDGDGYDTSVDCDDRNAFVYPGAPELPDGLDNDCDGAVDEGLPNCTDADSDGYYAQSGCGTAVDCDDSDPSVHPGATEICDGRDNDCDGQIDEGFDADNDGWTVCDGDCDDANPTVHPGAPELCDGIDNDCDGDVDEACDHDLDGFSPDQGDCDDSNPFRHPGAPELLDCIDNDCDEQIDEVSGGITVLGVAPIGGPTAGGTTIHVVCDPATPLVAGEILAFLTPTGETSCNFWMTDILYISPTEFSAVTPPGPTGATMDLVVVLGSGESGRFPEAFTYEP